mgnify:CR=1 FL=1
MGGHYEQLGAEERGTIMALRSQGAGVRQIARALTRAPSTILRELRRNGDQLGRRTPAMGRPLRLPGYDARRAGARARRLRRKRRLVRKLDRHGPLWAQVAAAATPIRVSSSPACTGERPSASCRWKGRET